MRIGQIFDDVRYAFLNDCTKASGVLRAEFQILVTNKQNINKIKKYTHTHTHTHTEKSN